MPIPELVGYTPGALRLLKSRKLLMAAKRHGANREGRQQIRRIFDEVEAEKAPECCRCRGFRSRALLRAHGALMKYAFWPGCVSRGAAPELYTATKAVAEHIGMELVELEGGCLHGRRYHF